MRWWSVMFMYMTYCMSVLMSFKAFELMWMGLGSWKRVVSSENMGCEEREVT